MNVTWLSPFPPDRDGIGDYSATVVGELRSRAIEVSVVRPSEVASRTGAGDRACDVVHVQFAVAAFGRHIPALVAAMRGAREAGTPVVLTAHEVTRDVARLRVAGRGLYRRICRHADHVIVHTDDARSRLIETVGVDGRKGSVIPMPQSPPAQPTTTAAQLRKRHSLGRSRVILAFGFIHYEKGLDTIVEALGQLQRDAADLDARLVVAGTVRRRSAMFKPFEWRDRFHLRNVRRLIRRNGLVDRVEFVGYVPDGEVGPWFDVGDVLVLAYRRVEQSGVGSLARSSQIPIVVSDAGCLAADFSDAGRTFPVGDCVALADRISTVMRAPAGPRAGDPDGSDHQGPSVAEVADRTLSIYQSLLPMEPKPDGVDRHAFADRTRQAFAVTSSS